MTWTEARSLGTCSTSFRLGKGHRVDKRQVTHRAASTSAAAVRAPRGSSLRSLAPVSRTEVVQFRTSNLITPFRLDRAGPGRTVRDSMAAAFRQSLRPRLNSACCHFYFK